MADRKDRRLDKSDAGEQPALPGTATPRATGRVARGVNAAIAAAAGEDRLDRDGLDAGAVALVRTLAHTVDWCHANGEPHTLTMAASRLSELLTKLKLEPASRDTGKGGVAGGIDWDSELARLGTPTKGAGTTEDRDAAQP